MSATEIQTRWSDLDALGHVGHTAVLTYLEEGRDSFLGSHGIRPDQYVVGRCSVTFHRELDAARDAVTVECTIRRLGRSSITTSERVRAGDGSVAVEAEFGLVLWNPETRRSRPITDGERASLDAAPTPRGEAA